jgi:TatD DNase family protein
LIPLIDSHCHLNYDYAPKSVDDLVREAELAGVAKLITVGTDLPSLPVVQEISARHANVFHTVGVHPHEAIDLLDEHLPILRAAAAHPKCRAIGEIGLDYHYDHSPRDVQRAALEKQLALALETKLPIVVHSRDGEDDLLAALTTYAKSASGVPGVIHCFTGTEKFGRACIDLGFYISFSGILTFKKADDLRACARAFPLERLLVETDSPYLAPVPLRGRKCEPVMVRHTALFLAELRGISIDELAAAATANTERAFGL